MSTAEAEATYIFCLYKFQGGITHQDFAGHRGTIRTGDVQVRDIN